MCQEVFQIAMSMDLKSVEMQLDVVIPKGTDTLRITLSTLGTAILASGV